MRRKVQLIALFFFTFALGTNASSQTLLTTDIIINPTTFVDSLFAGAPDGELGTFEGGEEGSGYVGIGGEIITFDFGLDRIVDGDGGDFNVYEVKGGLPEFGDPYGDIKVFASLDNVTYFDLTSTEAAAVSIDGDEAHDDPNNARSYDLSGLLPEARYIRIDGNSTEPAGGAGGNNGFDLDAVGGVNYVVAVPEVRATGALAAFGSLFALMAFLWERRRVAVLAG